MKTLVLGGTVFVGRAIVERLVAQGHDVALVHRGIKARGLFPGVREFHSDRMESLGQAPLEEWDWVVDTSAYVPRAVRLASEALRDVADRYLLVSTVSVYADQSLPGPREDSPLAILDDPETETVDGDTYGGLKVLCEQAVHEAWNGRGTVVRPGIVIGPHDPTDRFTFWATREGPLPIPDRLDQPIQAIDARDLASFTVGLMESGTAGTFNACGEDTTLGEMAAACGVETRPVSHDAWTAAGIQLPMLLPLDGSSDGIFRASTVLARQNGLQNRPIAESAADTLAWWHTNGRPPLKSAPDEALLRALLS